MTRISLLVLPLVLHLPLAFGQAVTSGTLTNQRVADLAQSGVQPAEVIRVIMTAPRVAFSLLPGDMDQLLRVGVSEEVIKAMAARSNGQQLSAAPAPVRAVPVTVLASPASYQPAPSTAAKVANLPEGTPVRMRINRTISSENTKEGDNVDFETLDDIKVGELIAIPKGSTALGTVTEAHSKRRMGRGGKLNVNIDYVRVPSGEKLPLRGIREAKGGGHVGGMTSAIVATSIVFFPAAPLFLLMHGKDIVIPKGHEITVYTNTEYGVPFVPTALVLGQAVPAAAPGSLTNEDILALYGAGLSNDVLIEKIKATPAAFRLGTDDLVRLKSAGVNDSVISAMLAAHQRGRAGSSPIQ